jgi:predicted TIM-barrel fold metal-dependent hydrolase
MRTPEEGIADLESIRSLGLRGIMLPGYPAVDDYDSPAYDEFWEACIALSMPVSFHILTGGEDIGGSKVRGPKMNTFLSIIRGNQDIIGTLIYGAVFERHPRLRVVCVEADAGWVPHWMYRADHAYERHRNWLPAGALSRMPSEYFRENVYVTFQDDWVAFRMLELEGQSEERSEASTGAISSRGEGRAARAGMVNERRLMWANDHPHSDSTWPFSQALLAEHTARLTQEQRDRVLRDNCAELYGITLVDGRG